MKKVCVLDGDRLRSARQAKGWSQQKLADVVGVHKAHVCNHERSVVPGGLRVTLEYAQAMGRSTWSLMTDEARGVLEQ